MSVKFEQLIRSFISGMPDSDPEAVSSTGTLKIKGKWSIMTRFKTKNAQKVSYNIDVDLLTRFKA